MSKTWNAFLLCFLFVISVMMSPAVSQHLIDEKEEPRFSGKEQDSDGDGFTDVDENACNSDSTDPESTPQDQDEDGVCDHLDALPEDPDETSDVDNDGIGDNADKDDDNDRVADENDDFPTDPCRSVDTDGDGYADFISTVICDEENPLADDDDDNDGVLDLYDAYPLDPCAHTDTDGDGLPNDVYTSIQYTCRGTTGDPDDDNDGYLDGDDVFPLDPTEWADFDEDGLGDNADINDDNDGWSDLMEYICGTDPYDKLSFPVDTDGDGQCDAIDPDDDNDGVLDVDDDDPLSAPGSWEWSFASGDIVRINDMAPDNSGNFFVTGTYIGDTNIGGVNLTSHNFRGDAFVAKIDSNGDVLWAETTKAQKKLCANDMGKIPGSGFGSILTVDVSQGSIWNYTNFTVDSVYYSVNNTTGVPTTGGIKLNTSNFLLGFNIQVGDRLYINESIPYEYLGTVKSVDNLPFVELEVPYTEPINRSAHIVVLDEFNFTSTSGVSIPIDQGLFTKKKWAESFAEANAIVVDANGDAYITGNFLGFIKFEKSGIDKVIKSYTVRNEGDWLRERYMYDTGLYQDKLKSPGMNNMAHSEHWITGFPCGAPDSNQLYGTDMFVAKINSNGEWEWAEAAGSMDSDTGEVITIDGNGEFVYVAGHLRHARADHVRAHYCYDPSDCTDLSQCVTNGGICEFDGTDATTNSAYAYYKPQRNTPCTPSEHVDPVGTRIFIQISHFAVRNHAGMFSGMDGAPELNGCGAYLAKIKASNGKWIHAEEISGPVQDLKRTSGFTQRYEQGVDAADVPCAHNLGGTYNTCSDMFVHITGIEIAGDPERIYISGKYAVTLTLDDDSEFTSGNNDKNDELGFVARYNPTTNEWTDLVNGCGPSQRYCDEIHDIETDGVYHYFISGCYNNQNFIAKYNFAGQEIWFNLLSVSNSEASISNRCQHTELALDANGDVYIAGVYWLENSNQMTLGTITMPKPGSPSLTPLPGYLEWNYAHFVAHIDTNGNWLWAEESPHIVFMNNGHPSSLSFGNHPTGFPEYDYDHYRGGIGSSRPTGLMVDSSNRVFMSGWINGAGVFKNTMQDGQNSYWTAIDGPLQYVAPTTTVPINGDPWEVPFLPASMTILTLAFAAVVVQRRMDQNEPLRRGLRDELLGGK